MPLPKQQLASESSQSERNLEPVALTSPRSRPLHTFSFFRSLPLAFLTFLPHRPSSSFLTSIQKSSFSRLLLSQASSRPLQTLPSHQIQWPPPVSSPPGWLARCRPRSLALLFASRLPSAPSPVSCRNPLLQPGKASNRNRTIEAHNCRS